MFPLKSLNITGQVFTSRGDITRLRVRTARLHLQQTMQCIWEGLQLEILFAPQLSIQTIHVEMYACRIYIHIFLKEHDGNVQMGRGASEGMYECVSVGGGYPEAWIVIDWPGRTVMQIHSSRLMFCHSALSAIKLAPVLKSPADNVAEAEITLHFPCAFLHLHPCRGHSEIYCAFSAAIGWDLSSPSWPARWALIYSFMCSLCFSYGLTK